MQLDFRTYDFKFQLLSHRLFDIFRGCIRSAHFKQAIKLLWISSGRSLNFQNGCVQGGFPGPHFSFPGNCADRNFVWRQEGLMGLTLKKGKTNRSIIVYLLSILLINWGVGPSQVTVWHKIPGKMTWFWLNCLVTEVTQEFSMNPWKNFRLLENILSFDEINFKLSLCSTQIKT